MTKVPPIIFLFQLDSLCNKRHKVYLCPCVSTQDGSPRAKSDVMEFEFSDGKTNRIAFRLLKQRDVEQDLLVHPEAGSSRMDSDF